MVPAGRDTGRPHGETGPVDRGSAAMILKTKGFILFVGIKLIVHFEETTLPVQLIADLKYLAGDVMICTGSVQGLETEA